MDSISIWAFTQNMPEGDFSDGDDDLPQFSMKMVTNRVGPLTVVERNNKVQRYRERCQKGEQLIRKRLQKNKLEQRKVHTNTG